MTNTRDQLEARLAELRAANDAAPRFGAAVSVRLEEIQHLEARLRTIENDALGELLGAIMFPRPNPVRQS